MNSKAESFKTYLDKNKITSFTIEKIKDDQLNSVIFRSNIEVNGQQLPTIVILDSSIYGMIRILVAPKVLNDNNETELFKEVNNLNKAYKSFKYYFDNEGSLIADCCVLLKDGTVDGDLIYTMFEVIIRNLNSEYKKLMQLIWK